MAWAAAAFLGKDWTCEWSDMEKEPKIPCVDELSHKSETIYPVFHMRKINHFQAVLFQILCPLQLSLIPT